MGVGVCALGFLPVLHLGVDKPVGQSHPTRPGATTARSENLVFWNRRHRIPPAV